MPWLVGLFAEAQEGRKCVRSPRRINSNREGAKERRGSGWEGKGEEREERGGQVEVGTEEESECGRKGGKREKE